jgi:hypothetical protein
VISAEREVIRECYRRLFAGEGVSTLVKDLNARGFTGLYSGRFTRRSLARTLRRPALAGLLDHHGEVIGELVGVEPVVSREEWERVCAILDSRKTGRPPSERHPLSGALLCGLCGYVLRAHPRPQLPAYPDGSPRSEYRCHRSADHRGCGKIHIDARSAEQAVDEAMRTRLGDPRRASRMAAHLAKVSDKRTRIEAEIGRLSESADELATKTAAWGVERVDKAMAPLLVRMDKLRAELAGLDAPAQAESAAADAVAAWDDAQARSDVAAMRAMVKRTFPKLTVGPQTFYNDHGPHRLLWDGPAGPAASRAA